MTPNVYKSGPFRFYFYSHESNEPAHVHIDRDKNSAKFWLDPVALASNIGFSSVELNKIEKIVVSKQNDFLEAWHEFFNS